VQFVNTQKAAVLALKMAQANTVNAMAKYDQTTADEHGTEADLAVARGHVELCEERLAGKYVIAPFDGVITERNVAKGEFVQPGAANQKPLFIIQDTHIVRVIIAIPEADVPRLRDGAMAEVEFAALPGKKWQGQIQRNAGALDRKTGCMRGEVWLPNEDGRFSPGMNGFVTIQPGERK
jgi:RND family efflux transporter MFP subunit